MCSYIVRIYRRDPRTHEITGIVETPESQRHASFRNFAELRTILSDMTAWQFFEHGNSNDQHDHDIQ
jgi:hypothetical protein